MRIIIIIKETKRKIQNLKLSRSINGNTEVQTVEDLFSEVTEIKYGSNNPLGRGRSQNPELLCHPKG
jgi:hypothetical protein